MKHIVNKLFNFLFRRKIALFEICEYLIFKIKFIFLLIKLNKSNKKNPPVLFVAGRGMNLIWAQIFVFLSIGIIKSGTPVHFLLYPTTSIIKAYFRILRPKFWSFSLLSRLGEKESGSNFQLEFENYDSIKNYH